MANQTIVVPDDDFSGEIYKGSFQEILSMNLNQYVICDFLVGTGNIVTKSGVLYAVGSKTIVLYQQSVDAYIVCDIFNVKFVTFVDQNNGRNVQGQTTRNVVRNGFMR